MTRHQPYCPQTAQIPAALIRVETCDTWKAMPAHTSATGHRAVVPLGQGGRGETPSYQASAPVGADGSPTIVHCSFYIVHCTTYTFSAKERDPETGLSYFGSRYYSSDLSIWLSVDPQSDKYASLSPYVYCADNPVKLVDPNGEDTIFVNGKTGKTTIKNCEGKDVLRCGANKVTLSGNGVFAKAKGDKDQSNDSQTLLTGMTREDAAKVFNFMADNTNVEWGYMRTTSGECFVGAIHSTEGEDGESLIYNRVMDAAPNTVTNYTHSHWSDKYSTTGWNPSTFKTANNSKNSDHRAWKDILKTQSTITMGIRYRGSTKCWIRRGVPVDEYFKNKFYSTD